MRYMTIIIAGVLTSCAVDTAEPEPALVEITRPCERTPPATDLDDPTEAVLAALENARRNDQRCGPPGTSDRICRALFAISVVDPAHDLANRSRLARSSELMAWVSLDGASVADDPGVMEALTVVGRAAEQLGRLEDEADLARLIIDRGQPEVTDPLDRAWQECQAR